MPIINAVLPVPCGGSTRASYRSRRRMLGERAAGHGSSIWCPSTSTGQICKVHSFSSQDILHPCKRLHFSLPRLGVIIQGHTHRTPVMAVILPDDLLAVELPEAGVVVGAGGDEVGRVGAEGAVPDPALVARQGGLQGEGAGEAALVQAGGLVDVDLPDLCGVVGGAGRQLLDVRRQQDAGDVLLVRRELRDGLQLGAVEGLDQGPDEDVALWGLKSARTEWPRLSW